jgi:NADPH:quinone reductase-like Zn-dependent oxidoreductase
MQIQKWQILKAGSIKRLTKIENEIGDPNKDEVQIAVKAIGLNFADIFACQGLYSATPKGKFTPGLEFSGIVIKIGKQVKTYKIGDSVMGVTRFGGYATHINIDEIFVRRLPKDWTFEQGAALIVQGLTAWYGLMELGNLKRNQYVLVQSAAGGVGLQAVGIIKKQNAIPIAVVGNVEKSNFLQTFFHLKPEQIIVRQKDNFLYQINETLKRLKIDGYHIIMDAVFGIYFKSGYQNLLPMGRYILFGAADMMNKKSKPDIITTLYKYLKRPKLDPLSMISENKGLLAFNLIWLFNEIETLNRTLSNFIDSQPRKPFIDKVFDFDSVFNAINHLQSGKSIGKVILKMD